MPASWGFRCAFQLPGSLVIVHLQCHGVGSDTFGCLREVHQPGKVMRCGCINFSAVRQFRSARIEMALDSSVRNSSLRISPASSKDALAKKSTAT